MVINDAVDILSEREFLSLFREASKYILWRNSRRLALL